MSNPVWKLKSGADKRFRAGHPWVYSNELAASPKGVEPGAPVDLQDPSGKTLARGYGNPASLIAFRTLSRDPAVKDVFSPEFLLERLQSSLRLRLSAGLGQSSYRLCFGEADYLPGLIIDRYKTPDAQVYVTQAHSAGAARLQQKLPEVLEKLDTGTPWARTAIIFRNDVGVRKLEGLTEEEPRIVREVPGLKLEDIPIQIGTDRFTLSTNLASGQKTGFYLDQVANIQLAISRLRNFPGKTVRILDLCCYVGQWSAQLAKAWTAQGAKVEVLAVDASAAALTFAQRNIEAAGARCETKKGDILKDLADLPAESFDLVISDPPALIKGRKDIPVGKHAYLQLNTQVFRLVKAGGAVVTCSCSGLLEEEEFLQTLSKAAVRNGRQMQWLARGGHGPDHPMLTEFPEGRYLKCWIGVRSC